MDQDVTWLGGRPWPRRHCIRWGPTPHFWKFWPMSIVTKWLDGSRCHLVRGPISPPHFSAHVYCGRVWWWRWALVSPDDVASSQMVDVSTLLIFPCSMKSRSSLLIPVHPGGPGKWTVKWLWCGGGLLWPNGRPSQQLLSSCPWFD